MNPLITFIQSQLKLGVSREVITSQLTANGWNKADVDQAFITLSTPSTPVPPTPAFVPPVSSSPLTQNFTQQNNTLQHKNHHLKLIISFIIVLTLIGGGAFGYYKFFMSGLSPTDILKKSFEASRNVKSFSFTATSTGQANNQLGNGLPSSSDFTLTASGPVDFHVPGTLLFDVNFGVNANTGVNNTGSLSLRLESIYVDNNFYLNLKNFKYTSSDIAQNQSVAIANGVVSMLQNKWIQFNVAKSINAGKQDSLSPQVQADKKIIQDYVSGMSYITAINTVGTETIDNTPMYHIKMTIQGDQKLIDIIKKLSSESTKPITDGQLSDFSKAISQKADLNVWIGKDDFLVYKIASSPININSTEAKTQGTLSQEIAFSDYNKTFSITAPQGATKVEDILKNIFGGMFSNTTTLTPTPKTTPATINPLVTTTPKPVVPTFVPFSTKNLLQNPGAETGSISGWTVGGVSNPSVDDGSFDKGINPRSGLYDFRGGKGALATLSQTVTLVGNQDITDAMIDKGNLFAKVSFWQQGLAQGEPSDSAGVTLTFLDDSQKTISAISSPIMDSHDKTWKSFTNQYKIPVGTRFIGYTIDFIRHQGNDNDAFVDDTSLIVTDLKH